MMLLQWQVEEHFGPGADPNYHVLVLVLQGIRSKNHVLRKPGTWVQHLLKHRSNFGRMLVLVSLYSSQLFRGDQSSDLVWSKSSRVWHRMSQRQMHGYQLCRCLGCQTHWSSQRGDLEHWGSTAWLVYCFWMFAMHQTASHKTGGTCVLH